CDLRQMGDRHDLGALRKPSKGLRHSMSSLASDTRVDLVEHDGFAPGNRSNRESDPRELTAGRSLGHRRERKTAVWLDEEDNFIRTRRACVPLTNLGKEFSLVEPHAGKLFGHRACKRGRGSPSGLPEL